MCPKETSDLKSQGLQRARYPWVALGAAPGKLAPDFDGDFLPSPFQSLLTCTEVYVETVRSFYCRSRVLDHPLTVAGDNHLRAVGIVADVRGDGPLPGLGTARGDTDLLAFAFIGPAGDILAPEQYLSALPVGADLVRRVRGDYHFAFFIGCTARKY